MAVIDNEGEHGEGQTEGPSAIRNGIYDEGTVLDSKSSSCRPQLPSAMGVNVPIEVP